MSGALDMLTRLGAGDHADRIVPPSGIAARLTLLAAAAMAFLAVFALALSLATGRLAAKWGDELARSATVRVSTAQGDPAVTLASALNVLATTPGITSARALDPDEQAALLEPWLGPEIPLADLPVPRLIEVIEAPEGFDPDGLRLRLSAEAPGAVLDDHTRWRRPLVEAAERLRLLGFVAIGLIAFTTAVVITLAATAALSANAQIVEVLRLLGARDAYIARAFVRRFTLRAFAGAAAGTALALGAVLLLPAAQAEGAFLTGLGFQGGAWAWTFAIPPFAAFTGFLATRAAAFRMLKRIK